MSGYRKRHVDILDKTQTIRIPKQTERYRAKKETLNNLNPKQTTCLVREVDKKKKKFHFNILCNCSDFHSILS